MSDVPPRSQYLDKAQVSYVEDPSILKKFYKNRPEELDNALRHLGNVLNNVKQTEKLITAELHLEERSKSHDPIDFRCCPQWTILTTKFKICEKFPQYERIQLHVLYRRGIVKDWIHLKDCGVDQDRDVLFVYIHSLQKRPPLNVQSRDQLSVANAHENDPISMDISTLPPHLSLNLVDPGFKNIFPEIPIDPATFEFPAAGDFALLTPASGADIGKLWTCKSCTFLNEDFRNDCCMCSSPRQADNSAPRSMQISTEAHSTFGPGVGKVQALPKIIRVGWRCPGCTFLNEPTRPGCEMCSKSRPADYEVPEDYLPSVKEQERLDKELAEQQAAAEQRSLERHENYTRHLSVAEQADIIHCEEPIECMICFTEAAPAESIVLRECLHKFCKDCIREHVKACDDAIVSCPFASDDYNCNHTITHREIKALLNEEDFKKFLNRGLMQAEKESPNSFHCKTPDCGGWCVYEDNVNNFLCPVCTHRNCLICKAIHEEKNCKEYQEEIARKAATDEEAKKTMALLDKMLKGGEAINCPQCNIVIQKKVGCDWIRCPMCKLEICWVTKGPRWGPGGRGDTSGGCRCTVGGKRCHKDCNNCH